MGNQNLFKFLGSISIGKITTGIEHLSEIINVKVIVGSQVIKYHLYYFAYKIADFHSKVHI